MKTVILAIALALTAQAQIVNIENYNMLPQLKVGSTINYAHKVALQNTNIMLPTSIVRKTECKVLDTKGTLNCKSINSL